MVLALQPALKHAVQPWPARAESLMSQRWVPPGVKALALPRSLTLDPHWPVWRCGQEEPRFVQTSVQPGTGVTTSDLSFPPPGQ